MLSSWQNESNRDGSCLAKRKIGGKKQKTKNRNKEHTHKLKKQSREQPFGILAGTLTRKKGPHHISTTECYHEDNLKV